MSASNVFVAAILGAVLGVFAASIGIYQVLAWKMRKLIQHPAITAASTQMDAAMASAMRSPSREVPLNSLGTAEESMGEIDVSGIGCNCKSDLILLEHAVELHVACGCLTCHRAIPMLSGQVADVRRCACFGEQSA